MKAYTAFVTLCHAPKAVHGAIVSNTNAVAALAVHMPRALNVSAEKEK